MLLVDRMDGRWLIAFAVVGTLVPALLYSMLGALGLGGLVHDGTPTASITDSLYFSIVTEATLGYGDLSPVGWSRLVACLQVIFGLFIAGLGVAKLSAFQGRAARLATKQCRGTWIEACCLEDNTVIVTVCTIKGTEGGLVYDGNNYSVNAKFAGSFTSKLTSHTDTTLEFHYSTTGSTHFQEGVVYLKFWAHPTTGKWMKYVATIQDFGKMRKTLFEGRRATKEEEEVLSEKTPAFKKLICELADEVKPSSSGPLLDLQDPS